jgi:hypothetical protein
MIIIYTINDPLTNEVKYIGKTKQPIKIRLEQHIRASKRYNHKMSTWLKSLIDKNLYPIIEEIDISDSDLYANILETMYIGLFTSWGFDLKNMTTGGDGQVNMRKEVKDKISKTRTGKYTGVNNPFYGKKHTDETINKLKGPKTIEHRKKNSESIKKLYEEGILDKKGIKNGKSKKVGKYDFDGNLIKVYDYIKQAEEDGYRRRIIHDCLNGKFKQYKGFIWKYYY